MEPPLLHPAISDRTVFKAGVEVHTSMYGKIITGNIVEGVFIDTMGIDGRKKSILGKPKMNPGRRRIRRLKQNISEAF